MLIQEYVNKVYITPDSNTQFRPPGDEVVPRPRSYEAVVFRDFFVAGLQFPLEKFVEDVLERFEIQIHRHPTPLLI